MPPVSQRRILHPSSFPLSPQYSSCLLFSSLYSLSLSLSSAPPGRLVSPARCLTAFSSLCRRPNSWRGRSASWPPFQPSTRSSSKPWRRRWGRSIRRCPLALESQRRQMVVDVRLRLAKGKVLLRSLSDPIHHKRKHAHKGISHKHAKTYI